MRPVAFECSSILDPRLHVVAPPVARSDGTCALVAVVEQAIVREAGATAVESRSATDRKK